jgi:hypothetical protein
MAREEQGLNLVFEKHDQSVLGLCLFHMILPNYSNTLQICFASLWSTNAVARIYLISRKFSRKKTVCKLWASLYVYLCSNSLIGVFSPYNAR